jgi:hypothetical protein
MEIEKNICESILGTLLQMPSKSKDVEKARLDMQHMGIQEDQHPLINNGKYSLPPALYYLGKDEKKLLGKFVYGHFLFVAWSRKCYLTCFCLSNTINS